MTPSERQQRDELIRQMRAEGLTASAIAAVVGVDRTAAYEIGEGKRQSYNERRREHWRRRYAPRQRSAGY